MGRVNVTSSKIEQDLLSLQQIIGTNGKIAFGMVEPIGTKRHCTSMLPYSMEQESNSRTRLNPKKLDARA